MSDWINPEDRMPDEDIKNPHPIEFVASDGKKRVGLARWDFKLGQWISADDVSLDHYGWTVTGWQPLPEPRQVETRTLNAMSYVELLEEYRRQRQILEEVDLEIRTRQRAGAPDLLAENKRLRAALEKIACLHVTRDQLWWQNEARRALEGGE